MLKRFEYVGPSEIRERAAHDRPGTSIASHDVLMSWLAEPRNDVSREGGWVTYVVDLSGNLVVAPRRTEHVACAAGNAVLAAGEIQFNAKGVVLEVTNNSTGYCPAEGCWESVHAAFDRAGLSGPSEFTFLARFRRCPSCGERNLVKDDWYYCALCETQLPAEWNF